MTQILAKSNLDKTTKERLYSLTTPDSQVLPFWAKLRQRLLGISPAEATVTRRGFKTNNPLIQQQLETVGKTFLEGYHNAIGDDRLESLIPRLNSIANDWRGFAYEGAAMGLALLDYLTPWQRNRRCSFLAGAGNDHAYMVYVGIGWALARIPWSLESYIQQLESKNSQFPDPLIGWLALDGYGFHQGYFYWPKYIEEIAIPKRLSGYSLRVFDQGLGRSLWFVCGADVNRITKAIKNFPSNRQGDLWSGIGLACTYAGGVGGEAIQALRASAGSYLPQLAQGSAFAAKARQRAGNLNSHTEMACQIIWGISAEETAEITDVSLEDLPNNGQLPTYEIWRQRIQNQFVAMEVN